MAGIAEDKELSENQVVKKRHRIDALRKKCEEELNGYLNPSLDINLRNLQGDSPLHIATKSGNISAVEYLLNRGAYLDTTDCYGDTALQIATKKRFVDIMKMLLTYGADVNFQNMYNMCSALHYAVQYPQRLECIQLLLKWGASTSLFNRRYCSPLHWAVVHHRNTRLSVVKLLLEVTVDFSRVDGFYDTVLHYAVQFAKVSVVKELLKAGASVSTRRYHDTPLHVAVKKSHSPAIMVYLLLKHGADINAFNSSGFTPLHLAAFRRYHFKNDVIKLMLLNGANIDVKAKNDGGMTPLHYAVINPSCDSDTVVHMMKYSKNLSIRDGYRSTILHYAVMENDVRVVDEILKRSFNVNAQNNKGNTALHIALFNDRISQDAVLNNRISQECFDKLLSFGVKVNVKNNVGNTPLHLAVRGLVVLVKNVQALLRLGADPNALNRERQTPLHFAAGNVPLFENILQLLVDFGARTNARDRSGNTPLHMAVSNRDCEVKALDVLLRNKASVFIRNNDHRIPLELLHLLASPKCITRLVAYVCLSRSGRISLLPRVDNNTSLNPVLRYFIHMRHIVCEQESKDIEKYYLSENLSVFDFLTNEITSANVPNFHVTYRLLALLKKREFFVYQSLIQHKLILLIGKQFQVFKILQVIFRKVNVSINLDSAFAIGRFLTNVECYDLFLQFFKKEIENAYTSDVYCNSYKRKSTFKESPAKKLKDTVV